MGLDIIKGKIKYILFSPSPTHCPPLFSNLLFLLSHLSINLPFLPPSPDTILFRGKGVAGGWGEGRKSWSQRKDAYKTITKEDKENKNAIFISLYSSSFGWFFIYYFISFIFFVSFPWLPVRWTLTSDRWNRRRITFLEDQPREIKKRKKEKKIGIKIK